MPQPILTTKLYIPTPGPRMVARPHLIQKLDVGRENKLILISAPAGYGKTTMLAEWINQQSAPLCWVSLDAQDNDFWRFFSYFIASMRSINIDIEENSIATIEEQDLQANTIFLSHLINQISTHPQPIYLVLDDYHRITNPDIHEALSYLLENLPRNMHLIIATRSDPLVRLAKLRAQGELCEIRADDLRFTDQETVQYFNQRMRLGLSHSDISALLKKTEGWIVGLQLAGISLQKHPDKHQFVRSFAGDDRYIADYLFDEAFNRQPGNIHSFLLHTSILDQFNAPLCDAVTGKDDSQTILEELDRANLFLVSLDNQRNWFRYHHLFGELLANRLQQTLPGRSRELHSRAAYWFAAAGFLDQAAMHAIKARDIHQLEQLIQENMLSLLETGEPLLFENQLSAFQDSMGHPNIWVCIARAWSLIFSGQIAATQDALQEAEALLTVLCAEKDQRQLNKARGHIATIRGYIASLKGDTREERESGENALALLPEDDHATIAFASMILASALVKSGENKKAEAACLAALQASEAIPDSFIRIDALCMLSQLQHMQGDLRKTNQTIEKALELADQRQSLGSRQLPIVGFAKIRKSTILFEWNQLEQAEEILNQGLAIIEKWGEKDSYLVGVVQNVILSQIRGNIDHAFSMVRHGKAEAQGMTYWFSTLDALEAWLHATTGNQQHVEKWIKTHDQLFARQPAFEQEFVYRYLIEILILQEDYARAAEVLKRFLPVVEQSDSVDRLIRTSILYCKVLYGLGENDRAISALTTALDLAQPRGYLRTFIDAGEEIAQLLYQCVQQGIHQQYCSQLLEAISAESRIPSPDDPAAKFMIEPLSQREIEVLQLIAQGCTNQEIAEELILSLYTVKSHARNIFGKLGVKNRTEAVARARLYGLLPEN